MSPMSTVRISRADAAGAPVQDEVIATLTARIPDLEARCASDGSISVPFPRQAPREALGTIERILAEVPRWIWRESLAVTVES